MCKCKKKKTGCKAKLRKTTQEPKSNPRANIKKSCPYSTPCGWCAKWDKKCDKKIWRGDEKYSSISASTSVYSGVMETAPRDPKSTVLQNRREGDR